MNDLLNSRITADYGTQTTAVLAMLMEASQDDRWSFEVIEAFVEQNPHLRRYLLNVANSAGRAMHTRIKTTHKALVRIGLVQAGQVLLDAAKRTDETRIEAAA